MKHHSLFCISELSNNKKESKSTKQSSSNDNPILCSISVDQLNETLTFYDHDELFDYDTNNLKTYFLLNNVTEIEVNGIVETETNQETDEQNGELTLLKNNITEDCVVKNNYIECNEISDDDNDVDPYASDDGGSDYDPTDDMSDFEDKMETYDETQVLNEPQIEKEEQATDNIGNKKRKISLTRKKVLNITNWRRNVIKNSRNAGQPYKNWKGKNVPGRKMKAPCRDSCRLKCSSKFTSESRLGILKIIGV